MTDTRLADIGAFLTQELTTGLGNLRMSLFWLDNDAAAQDDALRATHIRRLGAEISRLEDRADRLGQRLGHVDAPVEGDVTDAELSPTGGAEDTPVPQAGTPADDTSDEIGDAGCSVAADDPAEGGDAFSEPETGDGDERVTGDDDPSVPQAQTLDAIGEEGIDNAPDASDAAPGVARVVADTEGPPMASRNSRPRAGLPPAGLMALDEGKADPSEDEEFETPEDQPAGPEAEVLFTDDVAAPEDMSRTEVDDSPDPAGAAVIELRPPAAQEFADPEAPADPAADPSLGASIDALLDAAVAARSRSEDGDLKLDLETLERLLGEVRATMP